MRVMRSTRALLFLFLVAGAACGVEQTEGDMVEPEDDGIGVSQRGLVSCEEHHAVGYRFGDPFDITVVSVDGHPVELHTANAYVVMQQAAERDGVFLHIVSGFRTMA